MKTKKQVMLTKKNPYLVVEIEGFLFLILLIYLI